jgi:DNA-binding Xre family transcriptional regulator
MITVSKIKEGRAPSTNFARLPGKMIRLVVREHALREGIENPNALAEATGLPYESCRRLWQGNTTRIDLNTIERLCDTLKLRPGQLFDYEHEPDKPKKKRAKGKARG